MTSAFAPASACGRGCLPAPGSVARVAWPVQVARWLALAVTMIGGLLFALTVPLLPRRTRERGIRLWFRTLLQAAGVTLVLRGAAELSKADTDGTGTLIVANHISWLDIPAMLAIESMRVVAKTDVRQWPVIGLMAARGGTLFIDRRRLRRLPATVAEIAGVLRSGQSVLAFPEGSTWCGEHQNRFYPAVFQSAIDAGAPVRPLSLRFMADGSTPTTVAAFVGTDQLLASVWRVVATRNLVIEIECGPVADARGAARKILARETSALVRSATNWPMSVAQGPMLSTDEHTGSLYRRGLREADGAGGPSSRR